MKITPFAGATHTGARPRPRRRVALAGAIALGVAWSSLTAIASPTSAQALPQPVSYEIPALDLASPLRDAWEVTGDAEQERTLELSPGGVAYQGIPVVTDGAGPAAGDIVEAVIDVTVHDDVTADSTVLVRVTDGSTILAEWTDLTELPRGRQVTVTTAIAAGDGRIGAGASAVYVELHDDTSGTIEVHDVRLSGLRDGERVDYPLPNGDFAQPLAPANWSSSKAQIATSALLAPGAEISQQVEVGSSSALPAVGDALAFGLEAVVDTRAPDGSSVVARVTSGGDVLLEAAETADGPRGRWQPIAAGGAGVVPAGAENIELSLRNDTGFPLRLRNLEMSGTRDQGSDDLNGDGAVDRVDVTWFEAAVKEGRDDEALDYDGDGEVTTADISFYIRFVFGDTSEVFANLQHLDFLSEHVVLDGRETMIVHLYAEPKDRDDLSKGYEWVGDPQEGVSALDDVARATIVYAEHYATHKDEHSYDQMRRGLEFAMWMQAPNGDFDNFVARNADGELFKKSSQSSQTIFSFWAARAYEAMATSLPLIKEGDADLAARVTERLDRCLDRVGQLVTPEYGEHEADGAPKWLLLDDVWLSSTAVSALAKHSETLDGAQRDKAIDLVSTLGEGIAFYQSGGFDEYPLGAVRHSNENWYEWGSIQAKALATAGKLAGHEEWIDAAALIADSFLSDMLISGRSMEVGPNKTGLPQINYGTASYVDNLLTLHAVTGEKKYAELAGVAATWWTGNNPTGVPMFDQALGLAFDGITTGGVSTNSGAESVDESLRAILRVQRVPEALAAMTATKIDERTATTVEFEDLFRAGRPDDELIAVTGSGLNDPAHALVTQQSESGLDEQAIFEDAQEIDSERPIYEGWQGENALFVTGSGWNNVRIFDGGYIYTDVGVGGAGEPQPGDALMLDFAGLLQFHTDLDAEVIAVSADGEETVLADDSGFQYNPRTWYSGPGSVRTTLHTTVPEDADHIRLRFSNSSTNPVEHEGFVSVTIAALYRLGVPEVRYGSSAFSNRAYAQLEAGAQAELTFDVPTSGTHNLFLSGIDQPAAEAPHVTVSSAGLFSLEADLAGEADGVTIRALGRAELDAGTIPLSLAAGPEAAAGVDALILYPVETSATYRRLDGSELMILRDADARAFYAGTPEEVQSRGTAPAVTKDPASLTVDAGASATFTASASGDPAPSVQWEVSADGESWAPVDGATSESLLLDPVASSDGGSSYRAVFTNRKGTVVTESAVLTVRPPKPDEPAGWRDFVPGSTEELLTQIAGNLQAHRNGSHLTISGIPLADDAWVHVFGYSAPAYLDAFAVEGGEITVSVAGFSPGVHHLAVYDTADALIGYVAFEMDADEAPTPPGGALATTGGVLGPWLSIGSIALALGVALLWFHRLQRRSGRTGDQR